METSRRAFSASASYILGPRLTKSSGAYNLDVAYFSDPLNWGAWRPMEQLRGTNMLSNGHFWVCIWLSTLYFSPAGSRSVHPQARTTGSLHNPVNSHVALRKPMAASWYVIIAYSAMLWVLVCLPVEVKILRSTQGDQTTTYPPPETSFLEPIAIITG